jgi:paraquat-inducible protein B
MKTPAKPIIKKQRLPFAAIWAVPVLALLCAGYYVYQWHEEKGHEITIQFSDGNGLKAGETNVAHLGVAIGQVSSYELTADKQHVLVNVRLHENGEGFAVEGTRFWVVRPEVSASSLSGLGTIFSGPYIEADPGGGAAQNQFIGLDAPPIKSEDGLRVVLHATQLEHLQPDSPVYFRGIQVGVIQDALLDSNADHVNIHLLVWKRFAPLVRTNSEFWSISGADVKGGLFSGIQLKIDSLRALLSGGVAFATPDKNMGDQAKTDADFNLNDTPKPEWLTWSARIPIEPAESAPSSSGPTVGQVIHKAESQAN